MQQEEFNRSSFRLEISKLLNSDVILSHSKKSKLDKECEEFINVCNLLDRACEIDFLTQGSIRNEYTDSLYEIIDGLILKAYDDIGYVLIYYWVRDRYHPEEDIELPFVYVDQNKERVERFFNSPQDLYYFYKEVQKPKKKHGRTS